MCPSPTAPRSPADRTFHRALRTVLERYDIAALLLDPSLAISWCTPQAARLLNLPQRKGRTSIGESLGESALMNIARSAIHAPGAGTSFEIIGDDGQAHSACVLPLPTIGEADGGGTLITLDDSSALSTLLERVGGPPPPSRDRERLAVDTAARIAGLGVAEWSADGSTLHFATETWRRIHGLGAGPIDRESFDRLIHPRFRARVQRQFDSALREESPFDIDYKIIREDDGETRTIRAIGAPYPASGDAPAGLHTASMDVTESRQVESELGIRAQRLRALCDLADDWVYWLGPDATVLYMSPSCERFTDYPPEAFLMDAGLLGTLIHPDDRKILERGVQRCGDPSSDRPLVFRILSRDGRVVWIEQHCRALYDSHGQYLGVRIENRDVTATVDNERRYTFANAQIQGLLRIAPIGIGVVSDERLIEANPALCEMLGYTRDELLGQTLALLRDDVEPAGPVETGNNMAPPPGSATARSVEWRRKDGATVRVALTESPLQEHDSARASVFTALNIDERDRVEEVLREREEEYRLLFDMANDGVVLHALSGEPGNGHFIRVNQVACRMLGYTAQELLQLRPTDIQDPEELGEPVRETRRIQETGKLLFEKTLIAKGGRRFPAEIHSNLFEHRGRRMVLSLIRDITERKEAESQIRRLAFYDALTQLPNRRLLMERMQQALNSCKRHPWHGAILFIDLDNFKALNDTYGHDIGDQLLAQVAKRLTSCLRTQDTVARLGGDEFVVMLEHLSSFDQEAAEQAREVARKILATLGGVYTLNGHECRNSPSIGISLFQGVGETIEGVLKRADVAMYRAKTMGRNTLCFFDPNIQLALETRARTEIELQRALPNREFDLYLQNQVDGSLAVTGVEGLLRWRHPLRGLTLPSDFVPLAEDCGLIIPIGQWVLDTACAQVRMWDRHPSSGPIRLAINISALQFRDPEFVARVHATLARSGAKPTRLRFELPVDLFLEEIDETIDKMHALRSMGIGLAIDNFGSGYASLAYLQRLPLDQLKIDRSFVRDLTTDPNDAVVVRTIISMAKQLGLQVVAEGVENDAQFSFLRDLACDTFQGFLFGKPATAAEFLASAFST
ncbi:MAG: EAL domain-containing protein [Methylotetracoccus sp.]